MRRTISTTLAITTALGLPAALGPSASADGTPAWATVNTDPAGDQDRSSVAANRAGYTAVVWQDDRDGTDPTDTVHTEVYLRLYHDGEALFEKKVTDGGTGNWRHVQPDVALRADGGPVVVWAEDPDGNGYNQIAVRTFDVDGTETGSAIANGSAPGQQSNPKVAVNPENDGFAVVFSDQQGDAAPTVRLSGFAAIDAKKYEHQVHADGGGHRNPDVAMGAAGNAIVVWENDGDGDGGYDVGLASFTQSGEVKLDERAANDNTAGQQVGPRIAANANGDFVVGWNSDHGGAPRSAVRSFTATGEPSSAGVSLPGAEPQVGIDDQRHAVAYWAETSDVYVQGLNADGTAAGRQERVRANTATDGRQQEPALAVDPYGRITMTYSDDADGDELDEIMIGTGLRNSNWPT